jgi:hypothetical protein
MKRLLVIVLAKVDETIDSVLYRPAIVRFFLFLPRWWSCPLAKLSIRLDSLWGTDYWHTAIGHMCEACGRRPSTRQLGGLDESEEVDDKSCYPFLNGRVVELCGWCRIDADNLPLLDEAHLKTLLEAAAADSVRWRWR